MAHAQKPELVFRWNGRVHLNRRGRQFSPLLATDVCASAVVMLDTCSEEVWRVLASYSIRQFPLHFPSLRYRVPSHFNWTLPSVWTACWIHSTCLPLSAQNDAKLNSCWPHTSMDHYERKWWLDILGSHSGTGEDTSLVGYDAVYIGNVCASIFIV